jgi:hypothetical protein
MVDGVVLYRGGGRGARDAELFEVISFRGFRRA